MQKGIPYELNEDGKVKLDEKTTAGLQYILKRTHQRNGLVIKHVVELNGQYGENKINWDSQNLEAFVDEVNKKNKDKWINWDIQWLNTNENIWYKWIVQQ